MNPLQMPSARYTLPQFERRDSSGTRSMDPYSRLFEDRVVFLSTTVDAVSSTDIVAQLLALEAMDDSTITLYINSPGGSLTDMSMIIDTFNYIKSPVSTVVLGEASSAAAVVLASGTKGLRLALPSARIMVHQPRVDGGTRGQASDIEIQAKEIEYLRETMESALATRTGRPLEVIRRDLERDKFMSATEALEYGIIDAIIGSSQ